MPPGQRPQRAPVQRELAVPLEARGWCATAGSAVMVPPGCGPRRAPRGRAVRSAGRRAGLPFPGPLSGTGVAGCATGWRIVPHGQRAASTRISSHMARIDVRIPHLWWRQTPRSAYIAHVDCELAPPAARSGSRRATRRPGASAARGAGPGGRRDRRRRASPGCGPRSALLETEPIPARRGPRGGPGRLGRERTQRRVLRGVADPRPRTTGSSTSRTRSMSSRREGARNLRELVAFVRDEGIDCELEETGTLDVATEPWQVDGLREYVDARRATRARRSTFLDREAIQAEVHSPRFLAGVRAGPERCVMVDPAKLAWGSRRRSTRRGARDPRGVTGPPARASGRAASTSASTAAASSRRTTCSSRPPRTAAGCGGSRRLFVPVYDYVLVTEPLTAGQRASIGWARPRGHVRRGQPVPLLPADGRRPDPVGRLRRDLPPGQPRSSPALRRAAGDVRRARRATSSRRSPSSTGSGSRTAGAARSTRRRGSRVTFGRRARRARPLRARLHGAGRRGEPLGGRRSCATASCGRTRTCSGCGSCARVRSRSRRSPLRTPGGRAHAPVGDRRGRERGPPRAVPAGDGRARDRLRLVVADGAVRRDAACVHAP